MEYFVFFPLQWDLRAILCRNINKSVEKNILTDYNSSAALGHFSGEKWLLCWSNYDERNSCDLLGSEIFPNPEAGWAGHLTVMMILCCDKLRSAAAHQHQHQRQSQTAALE